MTTPVNLYSEPHPLTRTLARAGLTYEEQVARLAARYQVTPAMIEALTLPYADKAEAPFRIKPTCAIGAKLAGSRITLTGSSLRRPDAPLAELVARLGTSARKQEVGDAIRYWTVTLAVACWHGGADVSSYPRKGWRLEHVQGWWYGPGDARAVDEDAAALAAADIEALRGHLKQLCRWWRHTQGRAHGCESQIAWGLAAWRRAELALLEAA